MGTHLDAPFHNFADKPKIDEIPLERLYGPGLCWDLSHKPRLGEITAKDLEECNEAGPRIRKAETVDEGDIVFIYTGYGKYYTTNYMEYYCAPNFTQDAAAWLIDHKPSIVGVDNHSVDLNLNKRPMMIEVGPGKWKQWRIDEKWYGGEEKGRTTVHRMLLGENIIIIEHLANLDKIAGKRCTISALPLNINCGDGAPARVIAILEE